MCSEISSGIKHIELETKACAGRVNGKGGRTRIKIEKATGCEADMRHTCLEIRGRQEDIQLASIIVRCILGSFGQDGVHLDNDDTRKNCTVLQIPKNTSRMVIGRGGEHLHAIEEESHTIMFVAVISGEESSTDDSLAIFGNRNGRRLSQLLVMGLVESISAGFFTDSWYFGGCTYETPSDCISDWGTDVREMADEEDMAFIIGKNAHTRLTLMKASECIVARVGTLLFISGEEKQRMCAGEYIDWLLQQRLRRNADIHFVGISRPQDRDDCTILQIPDDCVAYITGAQRHTLNQLETSWGVLIFSLAGRTREDEQSFAIFGPVRSRCGANLEIKSWIEHQRPGFFAALTKKDICLETGFGLDYFPFDADEARLLYGKQGGTQKKLAIASHAVMQFIGDLCVVAGTRDERRRCYNYIQLLLPTMSGRNDYVDATRCSDITEVRIPSDQVHIFSQSKLQDLETTSGTLMILSEGHDGARLLICGWQSDSASVGRRKAEKEVSQLIAWKSGGSTRASGSERTSVNDGNPRNWTPRHLEPMWQTGGPDRWRRTPASDWTWGDSYRERSGTNWKWGHSKSAGERSRSRASQDYGSSMPQNRPPTPPRPPLRKTRSMTDTSLDRQPPWRKHH